jgi:hypothetical protein
MHVGFKNQADGSDHVKRGGCIVFEFTFDFVEGKANEAIAILQKLQKVMKDGNELGPVMTHLKFWRINDGMGYKCIEICRSAELYDQHCNMLANHEVVSEAMKLGELVKETSGVVYGLKAELEASVCMP